MRRAAEHFEALTHLPLSKSSLHALIAAYGTPLAQQEEAEAEALSAGVETPPPSPDAETMAVSLDGVMVHLREEGWKETKVAAFSAVTAEQAEGQDPRVHLERHSYRAGLWEAPAFAKQQYAEGWRRGLECAARVVAVSDGAAWIWNIVRNCYAPCVEIIDWWHALQKKLWVIAAVVYGEGTAEAAAWVETLKARLWAGEVRAVVHEVRQHWPRGQAMPEALRLALGYLWHHRQRMRYARFRAAGQPVGSGTVESACKVVVQERACQAGMRWSRLRLQALLALRCALLSDRWDATWSGLTAVKAAQNPGHTLPGRWA